jgi:CBS domain containing-hemolysin-like protein
MVGNISIYDWADVFGIDPAQTRTYTIAGLVAAILGKIPKEGDVAHWKNLKFTVERVRKHRIEAVILSLEPVRKHG